MSNFHQRPALRRVALAVAALVTAGGLAACGSTTPATKIDYRSDTRAKQSTLAVPPDLLSETADQRSLPPQGGQTSLSALEQVQGAAPATDTGVLPPVPGMHLQRDGTESWLVIDNRAPADVWAQVRRFWQEQGFLLVVDDRSKGVMETDWNETRPRISDGIIRNTLTWATANSYVTAQRNKYRTRLETAPNGGTYVFISEKGLHETVTGLNNESSKWVENPNDPGLEAEYLKRLMTTLANAKPGVPDVQVADAAVAASAAKAAPPLPDAAAVAAQNASISAHGTGRRGAAAQTAPATPEGPTEMTLDMPYDAAWVRVGTALTRANFTVDDQNRGRGLYFVRYVDPKDKTSDEQGFWNQVFHGRKEKVAKKYVVNVRAVTETQTRVALVTGDNGEIDTSRPARDIMALLSDQLQMSSAQ